jgi:hypothetical protein
MSFGSPGFILGGASSAGGVGAVPPMQLPTILRRAAEGALWSTWQYGTTGTSLVRPDFTFFNTPKGSQGQGFGRALQFPETNIMEQGRIPTGLAFNARALAYQPYACVDASVATPANWAVPLTDLLNLQHQTAWQWDLFGSYVDIAPTILIGAGGGVFGSTADTGGGYGANGGSQVSLNNGSGQVWIYQIQAIQLPAGQTFGLKQIPGPDAAAISLDAHANVNLRGRLVMLGNYQQAVATG